MADLMDVLPDFPVATFSHLLPSLSKKLITISDLLTLDAQEIAKRAQVPPSEVTKLSNALVQALQVQYTSGSPNGASTFSVEHTKNAESEHGKISTLDDILDAALGGGIPAGFITEVTGERWVLKFGLFLDFLTGRIQRSWQDAISLDVTACCTVTSTQGTSKISYIHFHRGSIAHVSTTSTTSPQPSIVQIIRN